MKPSLQFAAITLACCFCFTQPAFAADCSSASSSADDAYTYSRRGYNASDLSELHYYAKKAMNAAEEAESEANDCGCEQAASEASDAYSYARRAYRENNFDYAQSYIRRARSSADDAISYLSSCD
jgi:hypothetical protein